MKLKQRLISAFFVTILVPVVLFTAAGGAILTYQINIMTEASYGKMESLLPQIQSALFQMALSFVLVIVFTAVINMLWIYQSILSPIQILRMATNEMSEGNLDYPMDYPRNNDEIAELCKDFEQMRKHMKLLIEEQMQYEENTRELMSNISHDLKTPLTAIKGYAEGMLDGVADTPERREKYLSVSRRMPLYH